jgi:Domain of unknown function (DUF1987).
MASANDLILKETSKTPGISLTRGLLKISGRSIPEDALAFYQPIISWIEEYIKAPELLTRVDFRFEYINSGSNRFVFTILKLMEDCHKGGHTVVINWFFEEDDDTIKNLGKDFGSLLTVPFKMVEIVG